MSLLHVLIIGLGAALFLMFGMALGYVVIRLLG